MYNFQAGILVSTLFSISSSQPLLSQISLRRREPLEFETMGKALGIPDSGLLLQLEPTAAINPSEPLDKLLLDKRFRQSFMAFADRCSILPILNPILMELFFSWQYGFESGKERRGP